MDNLCCPYCKSSNVSDLIDRMVCHDCKSVDMLNLESQFVTSRSPAIPQSSQEPVTMTNIKRHEFEQLKGQVNFLNNKITEMRASKKDGAYKYQ